ncbi:MAG: hypothetical protein ACOYNS_08240 [Bacteroidota bacterium]
MRTSLSIIALLLFAGVSAALKGQSLDHVQLNDGVKKFGTVELRDPLSSPYLTIDSTLRIELKDAQAYQNAQGYFRKRFTGDLMDKDDFVFLKRTTAGKADLYSSVRWSADFNPVTGLNTNPTMKISSSADYISKPGYHVLDVDYDNLRELLADNTRSMQVLDECTTLNYYKYGAIGAGVLFVASGASKHIDRGKYYFAAGAVCIGVAWIPHLLQQALFQDAITEYNK